MKRLREGYLISGYHIPDKEIPFSHGVAGHGYEGMNSPDDQQFYYANCWWNVSYFHDGNVCVISKKEVL